MIGTHCGNVSRSIGTLSITCANGTIFAHGLNGRRKLIPQPGLIKPMGENGRSFSAYGFRSIFLIGGISRHYRPKGPERGFIMAIDKTVSDNAAQVFTITKTTGSVKKGDLKTVATYRVTGLNLRKVGEGYKIDPKNQANLATLKGLLGDFPQFAGSVLNTYVPVFLRGKLNDGFRGTLRQAVEAACSGKVEVVRSSQFATLAGIIAGNPAFDPKTMPKTAWPAMGFTEPPTAENVAAVKGGIDPWMEDEQDSE